MAAAAGARVTGLAPDARGREWIFLQALDWRSSERAEPGAREKRLGFLFRLVIYLAF